jgi:acetyl esterase/lipase
MMMVQRIRTFAILLSLALDLCVIVAGFQQCAFKKKNDRKLTTSNTHLESSLETYNFLEQDRPLAELDPPPDPASNPQDDFFRSIRRKLPKKVQYFLRDTGTLRTIVDTSVLLAAPEIIQSYPSAFYDFLQLSGISIGNRNNKKCEESTIDQKQRVQFSQFSYGANTRQVVDLIRPSRDLSTVKSQKLVIFVHGGAWGSGFPSMYRLAAKPFLEQGYSVAVLGYRTYPDADVAGQISDIAKSLAFLRSSFPEFCDITLMGHSSGAHLGMLGILRGELAVDRFVGISGVYDIPRHYAFERARGVERFSPMAPACGGSLTGWKCNSPTRFSKDASSLPPVLILHGEKDTTVPYTSSLRLVQSLHQALARREKESRVSVKIMPGVQHADTVLHLMFGGITREKVLEWLMTQELKGVRTNP